MCERVIIIGAGGQSKVVADLVRACGDTVVGFLDDSAAGSHILGKVADAENYPGCRFLIAVGDNAARKRLADSLDLPWHTAVHPTAFVSPSASIGEGTVVMPLAVIHTDASVGRHCIVNSGAVVEHDNVLADFSHVSPGSALAGRVFVGECTQIGVGASVKNNVSICGGCTIGAGAAVVKDIDLPGVYAGVPARRIK